MSKGFLAYRGIWNAEWGIKKSQWEWEEAGGSIGQPGDAGGEEEGDEGAGCDPERAKARAGHSHGRRKLQRVLEDEILRRGKGLPPFPPQRVHFDPILV